MEEVLIYLKNIFKNKKRHTIVLANSGGPDSMSLLYVLLLLRDELNLEIISAHVNHNIRVESASEEKILKKFCKDNKVIFESMKIKKYNSANFHKEARDIRYRFFEKVLKKYNADILMTAHHGDDLIETILMRIVRGSTLKGYSGFSQYAQNDWYTIIRPLIYLSKEEILEFNKKNNIEYVIDKSNFKDEYTRNRYRNHLLPFLHEEDKNVHHKFLKFSRLLEEASTYIDNNILKVMEDVYIDKKINLKIFNDLDLFVKKEIVIRILDELYDDLITDVSDIHVDLIIELGEADRSNASIDLPCGFIATKSYDSLIIEKKKDEKKEYKYELVNNLVLDDFTFKIVNEEDINNNYVIRLDKKDIDFPLFIRAKKDGDRIELRDLGTKKIKDIFIDSKIPIDKRKNYPVVVDNDDKILWIPGIKKSKYGKKNNEYYDIIIKCELGGVYEEKEC